MRVVIPADAGADIYKALYVLVKHHRLTVSNIEVVYPTRQFDLPDTAILLGVYTDVAPNSNIQRFDGLADVMAALNNPTEFRFLHHIPNTVVYLHNEKDKAILAYKLFDAFDNFAFNLSEETTVSQLLSSRSFVDAGKFRVVMGTGSDFLTASERIRLFKTGQVHFIVFSSGQSYGVHKRVSCELPSLSEFYSQCIPAADRKNWFAHRRGHVLVTKQGTAPTTTIEQLATLLCGFIQNSYS